MFVAGNICKFERLYTIFLMQIEIIKCHGSGNEFVMVDLVAQASIGNMAEFARQICSHEAVGGADGVLYVVKMGEYYAMRMFNPDGSEAEMCGNGIRCVARLVEERYIGEGNFKLLSGGNLYPIHRADDIAGGIKAYGVDIEVKTTSPDFGFAEGQTEFIGKRIASLGGEEQFTALNLGNPHIVAAVEEIDMERLVALGEAVKSLKDDFPQGINVSLFRKCNKCAIFVATYERGAGITYSCGTAMTASSTAAVLLGMCEKDTDLRVLNKGGMVVCRCSLSADGITTRLTGNATYRWVGEAEWSDEKVESVTIEKRFAAECERYDEFVMALNM